MYVKVTDEAEAVSVNVDEGEKLPLAPSDKEIVSPENVAPDIADTVKLVDATPTVPDDGPDTLKLAMPFKPENTGISLLAIVA